MKNSFQNQGGRLLAAWLVALVAGGVIPAVAQDIGYYRIASTAETRIVSLTGEGVLTWTNSNPDASCRVLWSFWPEGPWTTTFDMTNVVATGGVRVAHVPIPDRAPSPCVCVHNLFLIRKAMQRVQLEQGREDWDSVMLWDLLPYLPDPPPSCPDGGYYAVSVFGADPACSVNGHALP